jgi:hypothetical protein
MKISRDVGTREIVRRRSIRLVLLGIAFSAFSILANAQPLPALRPARGEITPTFWEQHGWHIVIVVVASIILVGIVIILLTRAKPKLSEPPEVLARRSLVALRGRTVNGALLMEVSRVFRRYLIFAFDLSPHEPTTAELSQTLQSSAKADPSLVASILKFLRECDEDKFSPNTSPPHTDPATRALELLEKIEVCRRRTLYQAAAA